MATITTYSDIDLFLTKHPGTGDITKKINTEAVKGAMKNILLTDIGQKPFDQYFGLGLQAMLFNLNTPGQRVVLERLIREKIGIYEPRVGIEEITIVDSDSGNVSVEIYYYIMGIENLQTLSISVERTR
jgi:phage baseplate assembly protein W